MTSGKAGHREPGGALITGGTSDIGRATAVALAEAGYGVAVGCRDREAEARAFTEALVRDHAAPRAVSVRADVRDRAQVRRMMDTAWAELGGVTLLVNAAGVNRDGPFLEMTDEEWVEVRSTILDGTWLCCQEFARRFEGDGGLIVNIGSVSALKGRKDGANYCSARAGVVALTKCLSLELGPRIRVNTVTPGFIDTRELRERYRLDDRERRRHWEGLIPMGRLGSPGDVAAMIAFLAGPGGSYVSGQNLIVDGGYFPR